MQPPQDSQSWSKASRVWALTSRAVQRQRTMPQPYSSIRLVLPVSPRSQLTAGCIYCSRIDHTLTGDAHFSGVPSLNPTERFIDSRIKAEVTLPDNLSLSIWHGFSKNVAAMADVTWANWSTIQRLRIRFENSAESDAVTTVGWNDTYRFSVGAVYMPGAWTFRTGAAFDPGPVPKASRRTPRVPDSDRICAAAGIGYKISDNLSVNTGYAHLFVKDSATKKIPAGEDQFVEGLQACTKAVSKSAAVKSPENFDISQERCFWDCPH